MEVGGDQNSVSVVEELVMDCNTASRGGGFGIVRMK